MLNTGFGIVLRVAHEKVAPSRFYRSKCSHVITVAWRAVGMSRHYQSLLTTKLLFKCFIKFLVLLLLINQLPPLTLRLASFSCTVLYFTETHNTEQQFVPGLTQFMIHVEDPVTAEYNGKIRIAFAPLLKRVFALKASSKCGHTQHNVCVLFIHRNPFLQNWRKIWKQKNFLKSKLPLLSRSR